MPVRRHGRQGWEVRIQHGGQRLSKSFRSKRDAYEYEARTRGRIADTEVGRTPRYTLAEALARWLEGEAKTLRSHKNLVNKVRTLYPYVGQRLLAESVTVAEQAKLEFLKQGLVSATINRRLAILRRVCNLAYRRWHWLDKPIGDQIGLLPGEQRRQVVLTPAEVRRLARLAPKQVKNAILLAAMSGARRGELLRLVPEDRKDHSLYIRQSKSDKPRTIPIPPEAMDIPLPLNLDEETLRKGFDVARRRAGLSVRFHDLRRTYATWLAQAGVDIGAIRDLLGHSTITMTSQYIGQSIKHMRSAVKKLPKLAGTGRGRRAAKK